MKKTSLFLSFFLLFITTTSKGAKAVNALQSICYEGFRDRLFLECFQNTDSDQLFKMANLPSPTPLFWATINGNLLMVKKLLKYSDFKNPWNQSALYWAVRLDRKEIISLLLSAGLHPDATSFYTEDLDIMTKAQAIKKYIVQKKYWHHQSITPLALAVKNNDLDLVSFFIKKGAKSPVDHVITALTERRIVSKLHFHKFINFETVQKYIAIIREVSSKDQSLSQSRQINARYNKNNGFNAGELALITFFTLSLAGGGLLSFIQGGGNQDYCPAVDLWFS